ncbi:IMPACT family protein [Cellulosimicrobium marinum]|uniref:IMPACT family protein n=1 Tax=Cellulosimicrobium marinum TaxID=1638992 RepID=UPI001E46C329|nr:YigZ family protein [Cellulosimicrobium marinum]MCB7137493.1 YigZ family protein [Cellulosimicrobium marinum]
MPTPGRPLPATIARVVEHELAVKRSRFLTRLVPVPDVAAADAAVAAVRKEHWDARHHCVALIVGTHADQQRSSDDGEPSGTAGVPMLEVLRQRDVTDVVAVVTRWFGGVLLGAGGLVRAYSTSVSEALDTAPLVRRAVRTEVTLDAPHAEAGRLHGVLQSWADAHDAVLAGVGYADTARFTLLVAPTDLDRFDADVAAATAGSLTAERGADRVVDLDR